MIDTTEYTNSEKQKCFISYLDFEKPFDKLNWSFLQNVLKKLGFGKSFRRWIHIMYNDIESAVINNGFTSEYFKLKCGIRQGCPLSALLFLLAVEIFSKEVNRNPNIQGVKIGNKIVKISQLADDTICITSDIISVQLVLNILYMFSLTSGLKLNYQKTEILQIGVPLTIPKHTYNVKWEKVYALGTWFYKDNSQTVLHNYTSKLKHIEQNLQKWSKLNVTLQGKINAFKVVRVYPLQYPNTHTMLKWEKEKVYALGTWFYKDNSQTVLHNYTSKLKHIEQNLQKWSKLNVTLQGKINAFKIHALSKINYLIGSLSTPEWVIKDLEDIQYRFIWSNLKRKLKHNVLIANYNEGGLKLTDIPSYVKAQKVNWIKRFLVNENNISCLQEFIPGPGFTKGLKQKIVITLREKS